MLAGARGPFHICRSAHLPPISWRRTHNRTLAVAASADLDFCPVKPVRFVSELPGKPIHHWYR